ncbi:SagB family peptide dehydrogenase [Cupriavidus basilensis]|nr:SagB family peptide dehydrogenase [Cupriavidus basilensis]
MGRRKVSSVRGIEAPEVARKRKGTNPGGRRAIGRGAPREWYIPDCKRGQALLDGAQVGQAMEVFQAILARLDQASQFERAVILGRLSRCLYLSARADAAVERLREAIAIAEVLAPTDGVESLRGTLQSGLGDALRATGRHGEARKAYTAALAVAERLGNLRSQGIDLGHLGALFLAEGKLEEARKHYLAALPLFERVQERGMEAVVRYQLGRLLQEQRQLAEADLHYREAARLSEATGNPAKAGLIWSELATLHQEAGHPGTVELCRRKAIELARTSGDSLQLLRDLVKLAEFHNAPQSRPVEARRLAEEALAVAQTLDPAIADVWHAYGVLGDIAATEAAISADSQRKAILLAQANDFQELRRRAPGIFTTLARLDAAPSWGRAVILGRLGRCFLIAGRPDLAVAHFLEAIDITEMLPASEVLRSLRGTFRSELGEVRRAIGQSDASREASDRTATLHRDSLPTANAGGCSSALSADFLVTLDEELLIDFAFDTDLLVDGPRERSLQRWAAEPKPLARNVRPMMMPCTRNWTDEDGAVHFALSLQEPTFERHPGCTVIRRTRRDVVLAGSPSILFRLIREMDGTATVEELISRIQPAERGIALHMLAVLAATGAVDVSGRPIGRLLHKTTKKGVLPGGGLEGDDILRLTTDGNYREFPDSPRIAIGQSIPEPLRAFHTLTRARRSHRDYRGLPLTRSAFDAILDTACGVTGSLAWAGRDSKLRAYPSSGGLYAVEIYPIALRVEGLDQAVYHFLATENALEKVKPIDREQVVDTMLPVEREMTAGAAAMICMTGFFPRHERKYGEGGHRMLVAEVGHIAQNLVLAATALGLSARPCGGVFDDLMNHALGLDIAQEQFMLSVLIGHAGGKG